MKPFFTIIVKNQAGSSFDSSGIKFKSYIQKFSNSNFDIYFKESNNPAFISELIWADEKQEKGVFLFGTFISTKSGLLTKSDNSHTKIKKILSESKSIPEEFCNGTYIGICFNKDNIAVFNDFFGLLPLYYSTYDGHILLSTEIQSVISLRSNKYTWNKQAISEFISFGCNITKKTVIDNIYQLGPANLFRISCGEYTISNYRTFPEESSLDYKYPELVEKVYQEFEKTVSRIYDTNQKYCLSLTGGADSRLVFFEWPNKDELMTETAGSNHTSDYIKASALTLKYGNNKLHELENHYSEKYQDGLFNYMLNTENPLLCGSDNSYHLDWKINRGANIRLSGVGGEIMGGENLYLSRKPSYVLREGLFPYKYHPLISDYEKQQLIKNILGFIENHIINEIYETAISEKINNEIIEFWDPYLGKCYTQEVFTERFRTHHLAFAGNYQKGNYAMNDIIFVTPFNDFNLVNLISKLPPSKRELRKLEFAILKKYNMGVNLPLDTTHLTINKPYFMQKFFRMVRFIYNIGYTKKVPFMQQGATLKTRIPAYFLPENTNLREEINDYLTKCAIFNKDKLSLILSRYETLEKYKHFKATHEDWPNILKMLKLAFFENKMMI